MLIIYLYAHFFFLIYLFYKYIKNVMFVLGLMVMSWRLKNIAPLLKSKKKEIVLVVYLCSSLNLKIKVARNFIVIKIFFFLSNIMLYYNYFSVHTIIICDNDINLFILFVFEFNYIKMCIRDIYYLFSYLL